MLVRRPEYFRAAEDATHTPTGATGAQLSVSVLRRSTSAPDFFVGPPQSTTHCHYTAQLHANLTPTPTGHFFLGAPKKEAMEVWPFLDAVLA